MGYITPPMIEVRQTEEFSGWLRRLGDANVVARITGRIRRMDGESRRHQKCRSGNSGNAHSTTGRVTGSTMCIVEHGL
jgi:putative component of toxin-antitoxin plasmid stabilization module